MVSDLFKTYVLDIKCLETLIYFFNFLENNCFKISDNIKHTLPLILIIRILHYKIILCNTSFLYQVLIDFILVISHIIYWKYNYYI